MLEAHFLNIDYDFPIAKSQIYYNIYALKNPLVYQDKEYNGAEEDTKFIIKTDTDNPIPLNYIDNKSLCVISCYNHNIFSS